MNKSRRLKACSSVRMNRGISAHFCGHTMAKKGFVSDKIKHQKNYLIFFYSKSIISSFLSPFFQNSAEEERKMDESLQSCKYLASLTE